MTRQRGSQAEEPAGGRAEDQFEVDGGVPEFYVDSAHFETQLYTSTLSEEAYRESRASMLTPEGISGDMPYEPASPLPLAVARHGGEIWATLPDLGEHGVGSSEEEAKQDLWRSLCSYKGALEQDESRLSEALAGDLRMLRRIMRPKRARP